MPGDAARDRPPAELEPTPESLAGLLEELRPRLERLLAVRLDPRVRRRVDPEDLLQEAFLEVARRLEEWRTQRPMPFFLWVRLLTGQKLAECHRRHLDAARRDAGRELTPGGVPGASSVSLAQRFVAPADAPPQDAARREALARVQRALEQLDEIDREILALRYFEGLTAEESAAALELSLSGANKRLVTALGRLRAALPRLRDLPTP